ncbi:hypothetical protein QVD17_39873 [Tagetes erecta]|uniref:Uncharacterized protein n=1 Tax=Tagetes erecta TaxID=13708 RepID=A0AAD8JT66_TARER|nr:hypothetical protein QVD17_39873 [Tagetes erecta]
MVGQFWATRLPVDQRLIVNRQDDNVECWERKEKKWKENEGKKEGTRKEKEGRERKEREEKKRREKKIFFFPFLSLVNVFILYVAKGFVANGCRSMDLCDLWFVIACDLVLHVVLPGSCTDNGCKSLDLCGFSIFVDDVMQRFVNPSSVYDQRWILSCSMRPHRMITPLELKISIMSN